MNVSKLNQTCWCWGVIAIAMSLSACASISLTNADQEKLAIDVDIRVGNTDTQVDVYLSHGFWQQPVHASAQQLVLESVSGEKFSLNAANKKGRYGIRIPYVIDPAVLTIDAVGALNLPQMKPVQIEQADAIAERLFFKDDQLTLHLPQATGSERIVTATALCGHIPSIAQWTITPAAHDFSMSFAQLMKHINQSAQKDLNGIIPVELAVSELYSVASQPPFRSIKLLATDSVPFRVDTSGFRFKADIAVQVNSTFFLRLQNQPWPVVYCY